ncbi:MAG: LysR substrate-binding domain-containing protein [Acetobacter sp.]|uniref:LysR substrate-binding domain-containing protein n=1 Tax=Acetobacter sp. TaxID=440 RepID=UPI0039E8732F
MTERPLDLGWVRVFEAVGRLGSLTAAARELGLSQPSVSYTIRSLETQLETPLLTRGHRGSVLSPAGRLLHRAAGVAVSEIDSGARVIRRMERQSAIRLFTDYGFASCWMMPRVAQFRQLHPDTEVHIIASTTTTPYPDEIEEVGVLFGARADFPKGARQLFEENVIPVASPRFVQRHDLDQHPDKIGRMPLLHLDAAPNPPWFTWTDWFAATGITRTPSPRDITLNTYTLVIQAAIASHGIALGWKGLVDDALADGTLVALGEPLRRPDSGYWLQTAPHISEPARDLVNWILATTSGSA